MSALTKDLSKLVKTAEEGAKCGPFRQSLHLMPPTGWLNDPNGLCQFQGVYHAFFQYSPFEVNGGVKLWGHYTSEDMIHWDYHGVTLYPDQPFDCSGVYSGCAFIEDGRLYLYYTGNVKLEDDSYDYVHTGREANTILTESNDGYTFGPKKLLMKNTDYPANLTLHVRDPKVWKEGDRYYMIQGARTRENTGVAVIFSSEDKIHWETEKEVRTPQPFGYMWECPDYFIKDGYKILSASVQGLTDGIWAERNVYQSGYFQVDGDLLGDYTLSEYQLWDYGFDYYAPQSFQAEDGRQILIGWMGMPDCEDYGNLPAIAEGWQHCFTFPREVFTKNGAVCQRPVQELDALMKQTAALKDRLDWDEAAVYVADIQNIQDNDFTAVLAEGLFLEYADGRFQMRFTDTAKDGISGGRSLRYLSMEHLENVKILADHSSVEVFLNDGRAVFSARYYPQKHTLCVKAPGSDITLYELFE